MSRVDSVNEKAGRCRHTRSEPSGYVAWHEWADLMSKTHNQVKCPVCGLYRIWKPKKARLAQPSTRSAATE